MRNMRNISWNVSLSELPVVESEASQGTPSGLAFLVVELSYVCSCNNPCLFNFLQIFLVGKFWKSLQAGCFKYYYVHPEPWGITN